MHERVRETTLIKEDSDMAKILVATEKPFAAVAVKGIREVVEGAGMELALWRNIQRRRNCWMRLRMPMP